MWTLGRCHRVIPILDDDPLPLLCPCEILWLPCELWVLLPHPPVSLGMVVTGDHA